MSDIIFEAFRSPLALAETVKSRNNNDMLGHASDKQGGFSGVANYKVAEDLLHNGAADIAAKINKNMEKIKASAKMQKSIQSPYFYGFRPSVARAIIGHPKSMIRREAVQQKTNAIHILYDISDNCNITPEELLEAGVAVLELVYRLEAARIRVNLDIIGYAAQISGGQYLISSINLKAGQEPLDVLRIAYPLAHPAFFRRHNFRWAETVNGIKYHDSGYGHHIKRQTLEPLLKSLHIEGRLIQFTDVQQSGYNWRELAKQIDIKID